MNNFGFPTHVFALQAPQKFSVAEEVVVASDIFGFDLPIGQRGRILQVIPTLGGRPIYIIRTIETRDTFGVPEQDLMSWSDYIDRSLAEGLRGHYITQALDTGNKELFESTLQKSASDLLNPRAPE